MGRDDLFITIFLLDLGQVLLQAEAQLRAFGQPNWQTFTHNIVEHEELQLTTQLAVVTLLGFFEQHEVLIEFLLLREGDTIDAGQLLALLVATPVSTSQRGQLHRLDNARVRDMGTAAKVGEVTTFIIGDGTVFQLADEFLLVFVAFLGEILQCFGLAHVNALESLLLASQFKHLLLDGYKVGFGQGDVACVDVVVETGIHCRTNAELHTFVQSLDGLSHEVGRRVPEGSLTFWIVPCEELDGGILVDGAHGIPHLTVYFGRQHITRQTFAQALGDIQRRHTGFKLSDTIVRKGYVNHKNGSFLKRLQKYKFFSYEKQIISI